MKHALKRILPIAAMALAMVLSPALAWGDECTEDLMQPVGMAQGAQEQPTALESISFEQEPLGFQDPEDAEEVQGVQEFQESETPEALEQAAPADAAPIASAEAAPANNAENHAVTESSNVLTAQADEGSSGGEQPEELQETGIEMHRLYNPHSGEHFYTASTKERDGLVKVGWRYEGVGWIAPSSGIEVYRLYNPNAGDHHYTLSVNELNRLKSVGWRYEGVGWFSGGDCAIYRQYNPNARSGSHNFTASKKENDQLVKAGWKAEGVGWQAIADSLESFVSLYPLARATVAAQGKDIVIDATLVNDTYYLFLPSYADLTAVKLSAQFAGNEVSVSLADWGASNFEEVQLGDTVNVLSASSTIAANGAHLLHCKPTGASAIQNLAVMMSSAVSAMYVDSVDASRNRAYIEASADHSAKADILVTLVNADGSIVYDNDSTSKPSSIKGRGNSTWGIGYKKPYQISLNKKADLLETGVKDNAQKKWVLLANANDATLLHNTIAYNLGLELDMDGMECAPIDLYYDGSYRGSYLLCEKVQVKPGRIDIYDLESAIEEANDGVDLDSRSVSRTKNKYGKTFQFVLGVADPVDITGGYILEVDGAYYKNEKCWFESSWGPIVVKSPEYCSMTAMLYISERFEAAVLHLNRGELEAGDGALFDIDSLAKTYLVNEYLKNVDTFYSSTYVYKDAGSSPFVVAPLWDFDASTGTRIDKSDSTLATYQGFTLPHAVKANSSRPVPVATVVAVQNAVRQLWENEISGLAHNILLSKDVGAVGANGYLRSLAFYRQQIADSQAMDEVLHGLTGFNNTFEPFNTYEANFEYLQNWLTWRTDWIDGNIWRLHDGEIQNPPWTYRGVDCGLVFDPRYYIEHNSSVNVEYDDASALMHFCMQGMKRGLVASRNFDVNAYRANNPDLQKAFGDNLQKYYLHYIEYGFKEGRKATA